MNKEKSLSSRIDEFLEKEGFFKCAGCFELVDDGIYYHCSHYKSKQPNNLGFSCMKPTEVVTPTWCPKRKSPVSATGPIVSANELVSPDNTTSYEIAR